MVERTSTDGVTVLHLRVPKVNAVSPELCAALQEALEATLADGATRAIVVASKVPGVFSAGLDLKRLGRLARPEMAMFAADFFGLIGRLRTCPVPVVAAVNGHAIAGGGLLLCAVDRRVAAEGEYRIGLPEVGLALPLPPVAVEMVIHALGRRSAREALCFGELYTPVRALELGFVDRLVPADDVLDEALEEARRLAALPAAALAEMRRALTGGLASLFAKTDPQAYGAFLGHWFGAECRAAREAVLNRLGAR